MAGSFCRRLALEAPVAQQVRLVFAQMGPIELVWGTVEMLSESLDGLDVALDGGRGVIATSL